MRTVGSMRLMMLLLEGRQVPSCSGKIDQTLDRYGEGPRLPGFGQGMGQGASPPPPPPSSR